MQLLETEPAGTHLNSPPAEVPCATLALMNVRSGRHAKVYGASGKAYEFRWREKDQRLVREYRSPADFAREELDLRKRLKAQYVIVTLMGAVNPVVHAKEAVQALINAGGAVQIPARVAALQDIADNALAAIALLTAPAPEEVEPQPSVSDPVQPPAPPDVVALHESRWVGEDGQKVNPPQEVEPGMTRPVSTQGLHTHAEIMTGEWRSVQGLAKSFGILVGVKSRAKLAEEILAKQAAGVKPRPLPEGQV